MYLRPTLFSYPKKNKKSRAYTRSIPNNWFTSIVVPVEFPHVCAVVHTRAFLQISHVCRLRSEVYYAVMDSVNAAGGGSASFVFGCAITTPTRYIGGVKDRRRWTFPGGGKNLFPETHGGNWKLVLLPREIRDRNAVWSQSREVNMFSILSPNKSRTTPRRRRRSNVVVERARTFTNRTRSCKFIFFFFAGIIYLFLCKS